MLKEQGEKMKKAIIWVCFIGVLAFMLVQSTMISTWIEEKYVAPDRSSEKSQKLTFQLGMYCYYLSNLDRAETLFKGVVDNYPESKWAHPSLFMTGKIHFKRGDLFFARTAFERLLEEYGYLEDEYCEKSKKQLQELRRFH